MKIKMLKERIYNSRKEERMTNKELELWKNQDWSWTSEWVNSMVKNMEDEGKSVEEIIEGLSKYGEVKVVEKEDK